MSLEKCTHILNEISTELQDLKTLDVSEMLRYLMQFGKKLPAIKKEYMVNKNFIKGCVSSAYLYLIVDKENKHLYMSGYSDVMIIRGFMGILSEALQEITAEQFLQDGKDLVENFLKSIDLDIILTPTRANAFGNIFQMLLKKTQELV